MRNLFVLFFSTTFSLAQGQTTVSKQNTLIKSNHNIGLTNPLYDASSPMTYDASKIDTNGAAFTFQYTNQGGTNFDGYPSGTIGGFKASGTYHPGNKSTSGMPIQIKDLTHQLRINWKTFQENANDSDDKWWATINVIFDSGAELSEPDSDARDYDLVIQNVSYVQDDFTDFVNPGGRYWYFARNSDNTIKPFTVYLNGVAYSWAVRYKFFDYAPENANFHKNNKVHIKFIPIDNSNPIPNLDHSLKAFIDCTKEYLYYITLTTDELALANEKVAKDNLWIKSISAGYEVYDGTSTLGNTYFFTTIDSDAPESVLNLTADKQNNSIALNWDNSSDASLDSYTIYRSINGGDYEKLSEAIRTNSYIDSSITNETYSYYVTAIDRSFNESSPSSNAIVDNTLSIDDEKLTKDFQIFPNPTTDDIQIQLLNTTFENGKIELFDTTGRLLQSNNISTSQVHLKMPLVSGIYIVKISNNGLVKVNRIIRL